MKSDFSRDSFNPSKHFLRVLQQQGKVSLDADGNEQVSILLHYLQTLARDLIGPHAAPKHGGGFKLSNDDSVKGGIKISTGRYYVDGLLIENHDENCSYAMQPDYQPGKDDILLQEIANPAGRHLWLYLDVWERHITALEDDSIREKALGGISTCDRSKLVWQVKAKELELVIDTDTQIKRDALLKQKAAIEQQLAAGTGTGNLPTLAPTLTPTVQPTRSPTPTATPTATPEPTQAPVNTAQLQAQLEAINQQLADLVPPACALGMQSVQALSNAALAARINPGRQESGPCIIAPDAQYRGQENHLYRVEIHSPGVAGQATFKWSRENGSIASAWLGTEGFDLLVSSSRGFAAGDWVELSYDELDLAGRGGVLVMLSKVEPGVLSVDPSSLQLTGADGDSLTWNEKYGHPKIRRWDQRANERQELNGGAITILESDVGEEVWLDLEDGVQVRFEKGGQYRSGDYWLLPARVGLNQIDNWPLSEDGKQALPQAPHGIVHHYAPLGVALWTGTNWDQDQLNNCYCEFEPLAICQDERPRVS